MKLKHQLFLLLFFLNLILLFLVIVLFKKNNLLFFIGEIVLVITIICSVIIFKRINAPIENIIIATELIKENDFNTKLMSLDNRELNEMVEIFNQMIEKLRHERVLQQEQYHFLDKIIKASPSGIILMDFNQRISFINSAAEKIVELKNEDVVGKKVEEINHIIFNEISKIEEGESIITLSGIQKIRCHKSHFIDRSHTRYFISLEEITSVTLNTQKESYEKVIRMMSHELNNSIGPINSILESLLYYETALNKEDKKEFKNVIRVAIERNKHLNSFMANFADVVKIPLPNLVLCDLSELLENQKSLLNIAYGNRITFKWDLSGLFPLVLIDKTQFEQVIHNIYKNATEAIDGDGVVITKTTHSPISLSIYNNGKAIPNHVKKKLFTPFFSTKQNGQGIGLMLIREILINHGFNFSLKTNDDNFTEFKINFEPKIVLK